MGKTNTVPLSREAAEALLRDAREQFENGVQELYRRDDEGQRPTIEACTEIIGRLGGSVRDWPQDAVGQWLEERARVEFEFSDATMAWLRWNRDQQAGFVEEFEEAIGSGGGSSSYADEVFLLHVLDRAVSQEVAA